MLIQHEPSAGLALRKDDTQQLDHIRPQTRSIAAARLRERRDLRGERSTINQSLGQRRSTPPRRPPLGGILYLSHGDHFRLSQDQGPALIPCCFRVVLSFCSTCRSI
jgi:hypothetical protein